jgi:hypothetical protein
VSVAELLQAFGLEIPSATYIAGVILFSIVGMVAWYHGRHRKLPRPKWIGVALMFYPYAVPQTWLLYTVGVALCGWLYVAWE